MGGPGIEPTGGGYRLAVGDVVLYDKALWIGQNQHANVVVAVDGDSAITVGGNEMGAIRVHSLDWASDDAVIGFGTLGP